MSKKLLMIAPQPFFQVRGTPLANKTMLKILSQDYEVDFLSYPQGADVYMRNVNFHTCPNFGIKKVPIGLSYRKLVLDIGLIHKTNSLLQANDYYFTHANEEAVIWGSVLARKYNTKLIYDMDSLLSQQLAQCGNPCFSTLAKKAEKFAIKRSDLILGISPTFEAYCRNIDPTTRYVTIYDIPQTKDSQPLENRYRHRLSDSKPTILYIGNAAAYQGIDVIYKLANRHSDYQFVLAGVGADRICDNLVVFSHVPPQQVADLMSRAQVLISPRRKGGENPPMKLYTYMSSGKPIVASNIKAHKILQDCAILVDDGLLSYKRGIDRALTPEGRKLAERAQQKVQKYNYHNLKELVLSEYRKLY